MLCFHQAPRDSLHLVIAQHVKALDVLICGLDPQCRGGYFGRVLSYPHLPSEYHLESWLGSYASNPASCINVPGKATDAGPSTWAPATHVIDLDGVLGLRPGCCGHLRGKPVDYEMNLSYSLFPTLPH